MKLLRRLLVAVVLSLGLTVPLTSITSVYAQPTNLLCFFDDGDDFAGYTPKGCDLGITKLVRVGTEGEFVATSDSSAALSANPGDTVTYQINVYDNSDQNELPTGIVDLVDLLPAGLTLQNASVSTGTFNSDNGTWEFTIEDEIPASLTLTATVDDSANGLITNTATLSDYTADNCDGPCEDPPYVDANAANNSAVAYIFVHGRLVAVSKTTSSSNPVVPNTGFGVHHINLAQELAIYGAIGTGLLASAYAVRRSSSKAS